jgi:hypothetical protein
VANTFLVRQVYYTVCQPVKISELGNMNYDHDFENSGNHEVARLVFADNDVYVWC